jgi:4-amino-4-deoxy-L-arabinose transferase-like glycosyltransferase
MSQVLPKRLARWLLPAIVLIYAVLGTLYAVYTPAWQAPDEPAHYNYIRYLAEQHRFPILKPGDYPGAYLEEIKAARFPPEMSIEPIRYEFHQPPFYYLLAVPIYGLFGGALLPLRLFSMMLGALLLIVVNWTVQVLAPGKPFLAQGVTAFVAFLPMHLAMSAAVNNDILAELLLTLVLLLSIRYLKAGPGEGARLLALLAVTTGLGLVTKSSLYILLPLVVAAVAARHLWLSSNGAWLSRGLKETGLYLLLSAGLALPWWVRNVAIYGGLDFLGLGRHDQVVAGQLRTAELAAQAGLPKLLSSFMVTTFQSFWGQFGWMGVLLDQRLYQALALVSVLAVAGFGLRFAGLWRCRHRLPRWQWAAAGLLALWALMTLASYIWYNLQFVQHQGRYLFRALVPIGLAVALGWREALGPRSAIPVAGLLLAGGAALWAAGQLPNWPLLMIVATAILLAARRYLPAPLDPFVTTSPYLLLILLDGVSLFGFIVPQLVP